MCGYMTTVQQQIQGSLDTSVMQAHGTWQLDHIDSTGYIYDKFLAYGPQIHLHTQDLHAPHILGKLISLVEQF